MNMSVEYTVLIQISKNDLPYVNCGLRADSPLAYNREIRS